MAKNYDYLFKVLLIGDADVGKTSLLDKFAPTPASDQSPISTIGIDSKTRYLQVCGRRVKLQVWNTAGQHHTITSAFYKGTRGVFIIYNATSEKSFKNVKKWLDNVKNHSADSTVMMMLGNNCHLKDEKQVSWERGKQLADEKGVKFMEVSAKTGQNIEETLNILSKSMLEQESSVIATGQRTSTETQGSRCSVQ